MLTKKVILFLLRFYSSLKVVSSTSKDIAKTVVSDVPSIIAKVSPISFITNQKAYWSASDDIAELTVMSVNGSL